MSTSEAQDDVNPTTLDIVEPEEQEETSPNKSLPPTPKDKKRDDHEVLVGTPVKEGHVNYMLMYDMLTGTIASLLVSASLFHGAMRNRPEN